MHRRTLVACLFVAVLLPIHGSAQISYRPTPRPQVTAASVSWVTSGEPIFFAGSYYYPTGPRVFFDGQLMVHTGDYLGVPLYVDTTLEAYSRVFVPVAGGLMKPYERLRAGPLAGTVGSTTPAWPVQVASNRYETGGGVGVQTGPIEPLMVPEVPRPVGTSGVTVVCPCPAATTGGLADAAPAPAPAPTVAQSEPRPSRNTGISVQFQGAEWFSDGQAVSFDPGIFIPVGDYHGFPVYRDKRGGPTTIWISVVADGPVAPYTRK
jgi:hypothetical protein